MMNINLGPISHCLVTLVRNGIQSQLRSIIFILTDRAYMPLRPIY